MRRLSLLHLRAEYQHGVVTLMVLQFFHQADLCFLFYRFMSRSIFTYTEGIVGPDEFNRKLHQGSHTYCRFHIVGEYEEGSTCRNYTSVESHTEAAACHRQLGYTGLQECSAEIALHESVCFLQETIRLV